MSALFAKFKKSLTIMSSSKDPDPGPNKKPPSSSAMPKKSILKVKHANSSSGGSDSPKSRAQFDEMNIIQTLHPAGKDYGHMKIDEPKTPYNGFAEGEGGGGSLLDMISSGSALPTLRSGPGSGSIEPSGGIDAISLAESLQSAMMSGSVPKVLDDLSPAELSDDEDESPRRKSFEDQRKKHYNEFQAVRAAREKAKNALDTETEDEAPDCGQTHAKDANQVQVQPNGKDADKSQGQTKDPPKDASKGQNQDKGKEPPKKKK